MFITVKDFNSGENITINTDHILFISDFGNHSRFIMINSNFIDVEKKEAEGIINILKSEDE